MACQARSPQDQVRNQKISFEATPIETIEFVSSNNNKFRGKRMQYADFNLSGGCFPISLSILYQIHVNVYDLK